MTYIWHGIEAPSSERLTITAGEHVEVHSTVATAGQGYDYRVVLDHGWVFRSLGLTAQDDGALRMSRDQQGEWTVDGEPRPDLAGAVDIDLSFSPFTNTLPIRRPDLAVGASVEIVTAYVEVPSLRVSPDPQRYTRVAVDTYLYESLDSDFSREITVDADGFVLEYPGLFRAGGGAASAPGGVPTERTAE